jgi:hypothetical protein
MRLIMKITHDLRRLIETSNEWVLTKIGDNPDGTYRYTMILVADAADKIDLNEIMTGRASDDPDGEFILSTQATPTRAWLPQEDERLSTPGELLRSWGMNRLTIHPDGEKLRRFTLLAHEPFRSDREQQELDQLLAFFQSKGFQGLPKVDERRPLDEDDDPEPLF